MLQRVVDFLRAGAGEPAEAGRPNDTYDTTLAVCALFIEMAVIDGEFSEEERAHIISILEDEYQLSEDDISRLLEEASAEVRSSTDYWQFTNMINENYTPEEKVRIIELLWKIIYADGTVEKHEDYLIRKLARLLGVPHGELIATKLRMRP
ncbi:MAG: TerB family tellurite resistance protein [Bacteroidota bacterium]